MCAVQALYRNMRQRLHHNPDSSAADKPEKSRAQQTASAPAPVRTKRKLVTQHQQAQQGRRAGVQGAVARAAAQSKAGRGRRQVLPLSSSCVPAHAAYTPDMKPDDITWRIWPWASCIHLLSRQFTWQGELHSGGPHQQAAASRPAIGCHCPVHACGLSPVTCCSAGGRHAGAVIQLRCRAQQRRLGGRQRCVRDHTCDSARLHPSRAARSCPQAPPPLQAHRARPQIPRQTAAHRSRRSPASCRKQSSVPQRSVSSAAGRHRQEPGEYPCPGSGAQTVPDLARLVGRHRC